MKRIFLPTLIIFFVSSTLFFPFYTVYADLVGETFQYKVSHSVIKGNFNGKTFSAIDVFQSGGEEFSIDNFIILNVTGVSNELINYTLSCDDREFERGNLYNESIYNLQLITTIGNNIMRTLYIAENTVSEILSHGDFSLTYYAKGYPLTQHFFFPPSNIIWDNLQNISSSINNDSFFKSDTTNFACSSTYSEDNGIVYFESWVHGSLEEKNLYNGDYNNGFLLAINKLTGVLQGLRIKGAYDGAIQGYMIQCSTDFQLERESFDLRQFSIFQELIVWDVFGIILIVFPIILTYKKLKNKC